MALSKDDARLHHRGVDAVVLDVVIHPGGDPDGGGLGEGVALVVQGTSTSNDPSAPANMSTWGLGWWWISHVGSGSSVLQKMSQKASASATSSELM